MSDIFTRKDIKDIPVEIIQKQVSLATGIPLYDMLAGNKKPLARKREKVSARQISMALTLNYTRLTQQKVGKLHGDRNHATVIHANNTVRNLIETNNYDIIRDFDKAETLILQWYNNKSGIPVKLSLNQLTRKRTKLNKELLFINEQIKSIINIKATNKVSLIKIWIRNHVPLYIRQELLNTYCFGSIPQYNKKVVRKFKPVDKIPEIMTYRENMHENNVKRLFAKL